MIALERMKMAMYDINESGKIQPVPVEGCHFVINADIFIEAIGQGPNPHLIRGRLPDSPWNAKAMSSSMRTIGLQSPMSMPAGMLTPVGQPLSLRWVQQKAAHAIDRMLRKQ